MENDSHNSKPYDEESMETQTRHIVRSIPISTATYGKTYLGNEEFNIISLESTVSELSFSSDSSDSDCTLTEIVDGEHHKEPVVELAETPSNEEREVRPRFLSLDETLTPETIGETLGKSGTVLMQRSRENRLAKQLKEMQELMEDGEELVVLKLPSVRQMHSQPAFSKEIIRNFIEHSETMFHLVHETQGIDAQVVSGNEEGAELEQRKSLQPAPQVTNATDRQDGDRVALDEFVGCFSKDDNMVLYKKTVVEAPEKGQNGESIDMLLAQHAQCLVEADEVMQPSVQICQTNDENLLALLKFSDQSSAVLKTSNASLEAISSYEDLNRVLLQTYRQVLTRPDEMISMQTQQTASGTSGQKKGSPTMPLHAHKPRDGLIQSGSSANDRFELVNESWSWPSCSMAVQGSSKNWIKCSNARNADEIVTNLRVLLEEYILRDNPPPVSVLKFLGCLLADIMHCPQAAIDEEYRRLSLIDKIKRVVDDLLMPHELEDPLCMVNQVRLAMQHILTNRPQHQTINNGSDAWAVILETAEKLVCELDHVIEKPDAFIEALQYGMTFILHFSEGGEFFEKDLNITRDTETSQMGDRGNSNAEAIEEHLPTPVQVYPCFSSWALLFLYSTSCWLKKQLISFWNCLTTTPPILVGSSVSFRETASHEETVVQEVCVQRDHLNRTLDVLRILLEKLPPVKSQDDRRSVNVRSVELFTQLLQQSGHIDLRYSDLRHNTHLQLHDGISGVLEERAADEFLTVTGNIRDLDGNVAVFFEVRTIDLASLAQFEPAIECITRVERLSDEVDESSRNVSLEAVPSTERGVLEALRDEDENKNEQLLTSSIVEEILSTGRFERTEKRRSIVEALVIEIRHCLQDLLEPVSTAVHNICERMADVGDERLLQHQVYSSGNYAVELVDSDDSSVKPSIREDASINECVKAEEISAQEDSPGSMEALQGMLSMFRDVNHRLAGLDSSVSAIRILVQQLLTQQQRHQQRNKFTHGDGQRSKGRRSKRQSYSSLEVLSVGEKVVNSSLQAQPMPCPAQQKHYCPLEVYSCHEVARDVLVVHWSVDEQLLGCIAGYEIHVDGVLRSVCFSNKRRTALIANIDLRQQHQLAVHATPHNCCKEMVQWSPAFFLYHL